MSRYQETVELLEYEFSECWSEDTPAESDSHQWYNRDEGFEQPTETPYVHFSVLHGDSSNALNCGEHMTYRQSGVIQLYIYVPFDSGTQKAMSLADDFVEIFVNKNIGHVLTRSPFIATPARNANWWETRVSIPFTYDTK